MPRYEDDAKPDVSVPLPAFPKKENLVRFPTSWTSNEIYIDTASLVFGDDETISYTLLVLGSGGAQNYTFESIRCTSGERRVLAYGKRDSTWSPARRTDWQKIQDSGINRYYFEFYRDVFCSGKTLERKNVMINNLRRGGQERPLEPAGGLSC